MTYKDQTFCNDWCNNENCFRNYKHIADAYEKQEIDQDTPIMFLVAPPVDCIERIPK